MPKARRYGSNENGDDEKDPRVRHAPDPMEASSWLSRLTFGWLSPWLERGNTKRRLDLDALLRDLLLPQSWAEEVRRALLSDTEPTLARVLWSAYY